MNSAAITPASRADLLRRGLRLEYFTVGWNVLEGLVAIAAALAAGSVALLAFGIDSFVETEAAGFTWTTTRRTIAASLPMRFSDGTTS